MKRRQPEITPDFHKIQKVQHQTARMDSKEQEEEKKCSEHSIPLSNMFKIISELGNGRTGRVMSADDIRTAETVALKLVEKSTESSRCIFNERTAHRYLPPHKHIADLKQIEEDLEYKRRRYTVFVLQLGIHGTLRDKILCSGHLSETLTRTYFHQLLQALKISHSSKVYHMDVKPENLILDENFNLLLCDWGLSMYCGGESIPERRIVGTAQFMAPEIHKCCAYDPSKADLWSAACVLFSMMTGRPPFSKATESDWHFKKMSGKQYKRFWDSHIRHAPWISEGFVKLINRLLVDNEADRPTIDEILSDPWMLESTIPDGKIVLEMKKMKKMV